MSLQLFNEFRPLFRVGDDPFFGPSALSRSFFDDPFFKDIRTLSRPAVNVSEDDKQYVLEAEVPGMKKENVKIRIGNENHSITIEGHVSEKKQSPAASSKAPSNDKPNAEGKAVVKGKEAAVSEVSEESSSYRSFTRTVWLPHAVDADKVKAKLEDGVLTLDIPKAEDSASKTITIQ